MSVTWCTFILIRVKIFHLSRISLCMLQHPKCLWNVNLKKLSSTLLWPLGTYFSGPLHHLSIFAPIMWCVFAEMRCSLKWTWVSISKAWPIDYTPLVQWPSKKKNPLSFAKSHMHGLSYTDIVYLFYCQQAPQTAFEIPAKKLATRVSV